MTRTPARETSAFGWKFRIPPRAKKFARIAAAVSFAAMSVLTVAVPSALAATDAIVMSFATGTVAGTAGMVTPPAPTCAYGYMYYNGSCYPAR